MEMEDGAEEVPNRVAAVKVKEEIEEAKKVEEKLYEKEDQLYESKCRSFWSILEAHDVILFFSTRRKRRTCSRTRRKETRKIS